MDDELIVRLTDALRRSGVAVTAAVADAETALRAQPDGLVLIDRFIAALAQAAGGDISRLAFADLRFLDLLEGAGLPLVRRARAAGRDLDTVVPVGPVAFELSARGVPVTGRGVVAHLPVDSIGLTIDAGAFRASGAAEIRAAEQVVGGLLEGDLGAVQVTVAALVQRDAGLSLFAILRADFRPAGIQLGLGFSLDSVGGMFGLDRTVDVDTLRRRLADGSAADALFGGTTTTTSMRSTLAALERIFPAASGEIVVGPTLRIGWLNVAGNSLVRLDVGVVLSLPRARVVLPGRAVLEVAVPGVTLVHLRADFVGDVDVAGRRLALDAALVDSQVLGVFSIAGTAAAFMSWGDPPTVVLTVGGFYPGFDPTPAIIPEQRRISIGLSNPLPGLRLGVTGYVAVTPGSLQFGGSLTAGYRLGPAAIQASIGGDAIIQLSPLWFTASLAGRAAIEAFGEELTSVQCRATLVGPGPLTATVSASTTIFWHDVGGTADFTLSGGPGADRSKASDLVGIVSRVLDDPSAISSDGRADALIGRRPSVRRGVPLISPVGAVIWRQDRFPLDAPVQKADGRILDALYRIVLQPPAGATPIVEPLATSTFVDLTDSAAARIRPYEPHEVGARVPVSISTSPSSAPQTTQFETYVKPSPSLLDTTVDIARVSRLIAAMRDVLDPVQLLAPDVAPCTTVRPEQWCVVDATAGERRELRPVLAVALTLVDPGAVALPDVASAGVGI